MSKSKLKVGSKATLGVFALTMLNVAAIVSLRNAPIMAEYGLGMIFFYLVAAIVFFLPSALVSAELATGWPKLGGVYVWIKEALGPKTGFLGVWMQLINNVVWFPAVLTFIAATLAYIFNPEMGNNSTYIFIISMVILWGATFANFFGMRASSLISSIGAIAGTFVPGILILLLASLWVIKGQQIDVVFSWSNVIPDLNLSRVVLFAAVVLGFAGMELSAAHAQEVKNPQKDYPKAVFQSIGLILLISILSSMAIAIVIPAKDLSLYSGIVQAFSVFLKSFNIGWALPVIAALIAIGATAQLSTWVIGPTKGLLGITSSGNIPPILQKVSKQGAPVNLLIGQALISSVFSLIILIAPNVNTAFLMLTAMAAQSYVIMYLLMFISAIRLRYSRPDVPRAYKIPGKNFGIWLVAGLGFISSLFAFIIGFFPPAQLKTGNPLTYILILLAGIIILMVPPFLFIAFKKPGWKPKSDDE